MKIDIDTREFESALNTYAESTTRDIAEILNQRAFNVASRTVSLMRAKHGTERVRDTRIRTYLNDVISNRITQRKSGKDKGKFRRKGSAKNQLKVINLVIQMHRRKAGDKGLYGAEMRTAQDKFGNSARGGVGFIVSPFVSVLRGLMDKVRFKSVPGGIQGIKVWANSKGKGIVLPAKKGWIAEVVMNMLWNVKGQPANADKLTRPHLQAAFDAEGREMMRHVAEKLQEGANKINAK